MTRFALALLLLAQDAPKDLQANLGVRGKLAFSDDFKELSKEWKVAKGSWEAVDGALRGKEVAADMHAAVIKHALPAKDFILQARFKLDGAKRASISFDGKGHVCRVNLAPTGFVLQRDAPKDGGEKPSQLGRGAVELRPGEWHTILVEVVGKDLLAQVDDRDFAFGAHDGVAADKTTFGFPVSGETLVVDEVKVWEATPNPDWASAKEKLAAKK
jgi:hypothetical protein